MIGLPSPSAARAGVSFYLVHDGSRGLRKQATGLAVWDEPPSPHDESLDLVLGDQRVERRSANSERLAERIHLPRKTLSCFGFNVWHEPTPCLSWFAGISTNPSLSLQSIQRINFSA